MTLAQAVEALLRFVEDPGNAAIVAAYVAFLSAMAGLLLKAIGQIWADHRKQRHEIVVTRTSIYSEIRRTKLTTQGHLDFVRYDDGRNGMIWLVIYPTLFPESSSLARISALSAREVRAITSFCYVYKETIGFLKASAIEIMPLIETKGPMAGRRRDPFFSLDDAMLEYVYAQGRALDEARRDDLVYRLDVIEKQSLKALDAIAHGARLWYLRPPWGLARLMRDDSTRDDARRVKRIAEYQRLQPIRWEDPIV